MTPETKSLLDQGILYIDGSIDREMSNYVNDSLKYLTSKGSPDIEVRINSDGGRVDIGLCIYDQLMYYKGKKTGVVIGIAASMGAIILQACKIRKGTPHARLLIHYIARNNISLAVLKNPKKLKKILSAMERSQSYLEKILLNRTKRTVGEIRDKSLGDEEMSATEALNFGLIDDIIEF